MATPNPNYVVKKIEAMLEKGQPRFTKECCIYRVPHNIRKLKEDAYTPEIVSIGPFHHGNEKLLKMEDHKRLYCKQFIERSGTNNLETFVNCVQQLEPQVRGCYSDDIKLSKEEHVMVILVDCCFILELLLRVHFMFTRGNYAIRLPRRLGFYIRRHDLLLLENQVPFFVLDELYNLFIGGSQCYDRYPSLLRLAVDHIVPDRIIFPGDFKVDYSVPNVGEIAHFTDLSRKLLLWSCDSSISRCSREAKVEQIYSATELNEAGVKLEVKKASQCLLDLQLSGHTLRIPFFIVEDTTEAVLRNLLAFEQCHCIDKSYLADYIVVLNFLINTDKDVDLLIKKGIIENWLGDSNAVAKVFNGLKVNILTSDFNVQYFHIFRSLNAFCARPWNKTVATLRRDYCNTPWKTIASIAGIFLLVLTVVQTVFSILQGVH